MILGVITDDYYPNDGHRWGGTGWARIGKYLAHLPGEWDIHVASSVWPADEQGLSITDRYGKRVYPDVLWCQRVSMPNFAAEVMAARVCGQRVVTDLDDLIWDVEKGTIAAAKWDHNTILNFIQAMTVSDQVVASTTWLSSRLLYDFKIPSVVIPNTIDVEAFTQVKQRHGTPYVGWAGSTITRTGDLDILADALWQMDKKVKFQHSGHFNGLTSFEDITGRKPDKVVQGVHPKDYPSVLDFHIGAVPLKLSNFNRAKSDIKGIEYAAAGIPFVASSTPAYKQLQKQWGPIVRLARTTEEWVEHFTDLLDFQTRQDDGKKLRELSWRRDIPNATKELKHVLVG
jgi:hypothetical protein